MVLSKSIIDSHYKELDCTWLFCFHFSEKCVKCDKIAIQNSFVSMC